MPYPTPWMRPADRVVAAVLAVVACGLLAACGGGPQYPRPATFAGYPADPALDKIVATHVEAPTDKQQRILMTTWFQDGTPAGASLFCSVTPEGRCSTYSYIPNVEFRAPRKRELPPETVALLRDALASLPVSQTPPLANMLIVSFWKDGQWQTRLYDRTNRPAGVSTIFGLTNAPIVP
jgi:hypothetical protein